MKTKINDMSFELLIEKIGILEEQVRLLKSELKTVGVLCNNLNKEANRDNINENNDND